MQAEKDSKQSKFGNEIDMNECIQNCLNSYKVCEETLAKSFKENFHKDPAYLVLLKSCAEICHTTAKFMMMQSKFHMELCGICAKVCTECADVCESMEKVSMKECIAACRKCAESCIEMSQTSH